MTARSARRELRRGGTTVRKAASRAGFVGGCIAAFGVVFSAAPLAHSQAPPDRAGARWFTLEVPAPSEAPLVPLSPDELAQELADHGFDGVVLCLPAAASTPTTTTTATPAGSTATATEATRLPPDSAIVADLAAPFRARGLECAVAHRATERIDQLPPWPAVVALVLDGSDPARRQVLAPAVRPAVRNWHWRAFDTAAEGAALVVSSLLLLPTAADRRATQLRFDLDSFGRRPISLTTKRLARQSALLSAVAERLGGDHPELVLPFENAASEARIDSPKVSLRRAPEWLDLDEWLFSYDRTGRLFAATLPWRTAQRAADLEASTPYGFARRAVELASVRAADRTGDEPAADAGILLDGSLDFLAFLIDSRVVEATRHAHRLSEIDLVPELSALGLPVPPSEFNHPQRNPPDLGNAWAVGFQTDGALERADPICAAWRLRCVSWQLHSPRSRPTRDPLAPLLTTTLDDPRLAPFADALAPVLGGRAIDLARLVAIEPGTPVTLTTTIAQRDPTFARLRVGEGAIRSVIVDGRRVVDRFDEPCELLTTLALPAGTSTLTLELVVDGRDADGRNADGRNVGDGRLELALEPLPSRAEGLVLGASRASQVREPVVRLADPGAFDRFSLTRPLDRPVAGDADAFLPFPLTQSARLDLWLHVVAPADGGRLELAVDDGVMQVVTLPARAGWQWLRVDAPFALPAGDHALHVRFPVGGVRLDQAAWMPVAVAFPRPPPGDVTLWQHAWRFDPLGAGVVLDLPLLAPGEVFGRAFELEKSATYQLHAWLEGDVPLRPGERAELEFSSASTKMRLVLPAGTPYEEWVALGEVAITAGERIELRVRGAGSLARVALLR